MTQEKKLEEAKRLYQTANADQKYVLESLFPELKESEEDEQNLNACLGYIPDEFLRRWLTDVIHTKDKKADWSKEDDNHLHSIYHYLRILKDESDNDSVKKNIEEHINWLSKLYQIFLVSQQKQEWGEEDEAKLKSAYVLIRNTRLNGNEGVVDSTIDWLKLFKQRYTWKPSIEQMEALWCAAERYLESDDPNVVELRGKVLESLYNDLKKLKGE